MEHESGSISRSSSRLATATQMRLNGSANKISSIKLLIFCQPKARRVPLGELILSANSVSIPFHALSRTLLRSQYSCTASVRRGYWDPTNIDPWYPQRLADSTNHPGFICNYRRFVCEIRARGQPDHSTILETRTNLNRFAIQSAQFPTSENALAIMIDTTIQNRLKRLCRKCPLSKPKL